MSVEFETLWAERKADRRKELRPAPTYKKPTKTGTPTTTHSEKGLSSETTLPSHSKVETPVQQGSADASLAGGLSY
jgi:hypothetical protein